LKPGQLPDVESTAPGSDLPVHLPGVVTHPIGPEPADALPGKRGLPVHQAAFPADPNTTTGFRGPHREDPEMGIVEATTGEIAGEEGVTRREDDTAKRGL